ncbi:uncharacterized protein LOC128882683 isoform X2 [Hylaeus volcanicus]|uniref:uncharacterized protein LOC128882683 isoform X2 n=1 Tax=Hylaeus volcanicus TaxID=313075 RepID=UPI0023B78388|nr:uncharacterized protein LOC128882683 isoform X2 [Hylaeus volcanicus]
MCSVEKENFFKLQYLFSCEDCTLSEETTASHGNILVAHDSQRVGNHLEHYLAISCDEAKIQQFRWRAENSSKQSTNIVFLNENSYVVAMTYIPLLMNQKGGDKTQKLYLLLGFESGRISIYDWKTLYYTGFLPCFELKRNLSISSFTFDKSLSLIRQTQTYQSNNKPGCLLIHFSTKQDTKRHPSGSNDGSKNIVLGVSLIDFHNYLKKNQMVSIYPISFYIYILPTDTIDYAVLPRFECHTFDCLASVPSEKNSCVLPELSALDIHTSDKNDIQELKNYKETVQDPSPTRCHAQPYQTWKKECKDLSDFEKEKKNIFLFNLRKSVAYGLKNFFNEDFSLIFCILSNDVFLYQMTTRPPQNEETGFHRDKRNFGDKNVPNAKASENFNSKKSPHVFKGVTLGLKATSSVFSFVKPFSSRLFGHVEKHSLGPSYSNDFHENIPTNIVPLNVGMTEALSSNIHLKPVFLYPFKTRIDHDRRGIRLFRCPYNNHLALATDNFGRVLFLHLPSMQLVYMWKGYRFAQVAWIKRNDQLYIVLYAPLQGILELWCLQSIQRVNVIKVSMYGVLVSNQSQTNNEKTLPFVFVNNEGSIFALSTNL